MRGKIIVIEGADGCGKETQSKLLKTYLNMTEGIKTIRCSFPQYTTKGAGPVELYLGGKLGSINDMTYMQISSLYAVDRLCAIKSQKWDELLDSGTWIICDRYVESNIIYQASKDMEHAKEITEGIKKLEYDLLGIPKPDIVIYLDLDEAISEELIKDRGNKTDIHEQDTEYMKKVHECGVQIAKDEGWTIINCNSFDRTDILPRPDIAAKIQKHVSSLIYNRNPII